MDYHGKFAQALEALTSEGRYRVFADILRHRGEFPRAVHHTPQGTKPITVWCSNDYLVHGPESEGFGGHARGDRHSRRRLGRHPQHLRNDPLPRRTGKRNCRSARQGGSPSVHLGLRFERSDAFDAREDPEGRDYLLRREEPRFHDRGRSPRRRPEADLAA